MNKLGSSSFLSGFAISIAAYCYSTLSGAVTGAFIFSFGLITVVLYKWKLYTGTAGFVKTSNEFKTLIPILLFNIIGCATASLVLSTFTEGIQNEFINKAIEARKCKTHLQVITILSRALFCGFIMTTAVKFARIGLDKGFRYFIPLLLGVPLFLICGFFHSIVDGFYVSYGLVNGLPSLATIVDILQALISWILVVIGNFIGCNLTRLVLFEKDA